MTLLANYTAIADSIAALFYPHAEVIVHDIASQTVLHIANNFSKRSPGDDSALDDALDDFQHADTLGPYEKLNWDGQKVRSISAVLRDAEGQPEYLLCINFNVSVLEQAHQALAAFFQLQRVIPQPEGLFKNDWQERINTFLQAWLEQHNLSLRTLRAKDKRALVEALFAEGAFDARSSADYIANVLEMGRATVYKYLKALRG
ncbi:PAS domain-containing protein [Pseudomonas sp. RP23018S]|uniref:helix-turn-helix transcriptional regulator n=1 Tax=Pseudomonas sp. RP23018S TaxID=3096037 RepID=UPI002ACAC7A5|nr:PAS domain-containing protein [Pseudomonas sp. RP23018S]MDZ5602133.1 PAS domain-containing protein [Pseudomonas sp. RP23018S]